MEITIMSEEERYNNRQIERMLDEQSTDIKGHMDAAIAPLIVQTTKTNGRVGVMEKMVWMAAGAVVILTPFTYYLATEIGTIKDDLRETVREEARTAVDEAFDARINALEVAE
jgi:hypothetical protein